MNKQTTAVQHKLEILAALHGIYYVISGVWPIVHMRSFIAVTGPKIDLWLVETVGVLVLVIGLGLLAAAKKNRISFPMSIIAAGAALGLTCIDLIYVWEGTLSAVYLLDAVIEIVLLLAWIIFIIQGKLWAR